MIDRCLAADEIGLLEELPADDRRSRHVEGCPRCRALLRSYREFVTEAPPPATAREREARNELSAALDREIFGEAAHRASATPRRAGDPAGRRRWWDFPSWVPQPLVRPALAVASVALVAIGVAQLLPQHHGGDPTGVVRGGSTGDALRATAITRADGRPEVAWTLMSGADRYEVVVFGADLRELARFDAGAGSSLAIDPGRLPPPAAEQTALFGRIIARRGGDEVGRSNVVTFTLVPR